MKNLTLILLLVISSLSYAQLNIEQPSDLSICDTDSDGFEIFDLTSTSFEILINLDASMYTISYYETLSSAENDVDAITNSISYGNITNPQTIYVRVWENADPTNFAITNFEISALSSPAIIQPPNLIIYQYPFTELAEFDLTVNEEIILNGQDASEFSITYHATLADAQNQTNAYAFATSYNNTTNPEDVFVNVTSINTGCFETTSFQLIVEEDIINIPDPNFLSRLIAEGVDTNSSGNIQSFEASATSELNVSNSNISDLTGIEAFTALETLFCQNTQLTTLDCNNNPNLTALYIASNDLLETVFIKNGSDESSNMDSGSWLENWFVGNNPSLSYVCADDSQVVEIQPFAEGNYPVSSYCTITPGGDFNTITGNVLFDLNEDGCDPSDIAQTYIRMDIDDGETQGATYTTLDGNYNFYTSEGDFGITPNVEQPSWFNISPLTTTIPFTDSNNNVATQDFCLTADGIHNDVEIAIAPLMPARPGFDALYLIVYNNKGNQAVSGDFEFTYDDTVLDFISANQTPDNQDSGSLIWNYDNLLPFESRSVQVTLNVNGPTETPPVNIDDVLAFQATINPISGDEFSDDNTFDYDQVVVGSFDPNDITCLQGDVLPTAEIGNFLHYIINFENIGTAPAENVVVELDVDDAQFDINTLRVLNASHEMQTELQNNKIKFVFNGINLGATGGHGNILIRMKSNQNLVSGNTVTKKANIFFDYNFPIETNVASTTFQNSLSEDDFQLGKSLMVFPNPVFDLVNIKAASLIMSIEVYDMQGRMLVSQLVSNKETQLDMSSYSNGIYILKVNSNKGSITKEIIKN